MLPDTFMILPVVIANWLRGFDSRFELEVWKPRKMPDLHVSLIHRSKDFFRLAKTKVKRFEPAITKPVVPRQEVRLDCGGSLDDLRGTNHGRIIMSDLPDLVLRRFPDSWELRLPERKSSLSVEIPVFTQKVVGLMVAVPSGTKTGQSIKLHFVQRHRKTKRIVGGVALQVNVGTKIRTEKI